MKKITFLFAFLLSLFGGTQAWADAYTCSFETSEGWTASYGSLSAVGTEWKNVGGLTDFKLNSTYAHTGYGVAWYDASSSSATNSNKYLITPKLAAGTISFWAKSKSDVSSCKITFYTCDENGDNRSLLKTYTGDGGGLTTTMSEISFNDLTVDSHLAILISKAGMDDFTALNGLASDAPVEGPQFVVKDGSTKLTTGYAYDFGLTTAGTTHTFTLSNPGTVDVTVTVSETGSFSATPSNTKIVAGEEETLTVTMPATTGSSAVTITPDGGLDPFVLNVSGTIRDPNKVYLDFSDGSMPEGWTSVPVGSYASGYSTYSWKVSEGYIGTSATSGIYQYAFTSPKLTFEKDETIMFESAKYSSSLSNLVVEYSVDGSTWTAIGTAITDDVQGKWTKRSISIPTADAKYIRFNGRNLYLRNIYGGELPLEPKMVVTQPASLDFGLLDKDATPATNTFTIANTGRATLNGISVTSANVAFTVTGAPSSLAAGASQEVTITMATGTTGALSSLITVSATGMEDATFTVSGVVMPNDAFVIDFNDNLPSGWGNNASNKWSFSDGKAYCTSAAELTTPKLQFADGDFFVVNITSYDDYDNNYLEIYTSTDGTSWEGSPIKRYISRSQIPYGSYTNLVVTDIPTSVKYLKFKGYYVRIDEITGLTYAPVLSVTKDAAAVTTPAAYDFRECGANASVTYNFANAGAGTINITNVAITGDGAAAYSTNWTTSVAAPFDLVITRAYDAERGGAAQDAVVTVTTSEGDFVINVTGTDLAADAPTMGVTLGGAAVANGDAADFGTKLKAAPAAKTYTITNTGTGTLTGTIVTSDETQFTVSKTSFSLAASESTTFDLALVFDTSYGDKAATITIHPTVDGLEDVVINATASTMDPETWEEDFEGGTLSMGWETNSDSKKWFVGTFSNYENTSKMALAPTGSSAGYIITPRLAAKKDEVLTWDAYFNWYDEAMTVEYSNDNQETWTKIYDAYKAQSEFGNTRYTHKEMSFTAPADGDYYLRFTSTYQNGVDNFCGFKLNLPNHIMAITGSNIPTSGSYSPSMKATKSFNATVTVKESRGVAEEDVVAKLYMGSTVIGSSDPVDFEANEAKTITIVCTPAVAATEGVEMHIEVEYAGGTLSTTPEIRYVAELVRLDMTEDSEPTISTGYSAIYDVVTLTRNFVEGWNTFVAPCAVTLTDIHAGAIAYSFSNYEEGTLTFTQVNSTTLTAATPYIIYVPSKLDDKVLSWESPVIYSSYVGEENIRTTHNEATFQGTYAPMAAGTMTGKWGVTNEAKIAKGTSKASMDGFRAYFTLPDGASARLAFIDEDGTTTVINALELNQNVEGVYNLQGQKVERLQKGLYIVNGKKVVRK